MKYVGITNNPRRRAAQHQVSGKSGRVQVETGGMPRNKARQWESATLARYRKNNEGKNPIYNKTKTGGRKS